MSIVTLRWVESLMMVGTDSNGHSVVIGRSPVDHSEFTGIKPSDLLLLAVASCSAYDVIEILRKQREPMRDLKVICEGDQEAKPPHKFNRIHLHYMVHGDVKPERLEKAIRLSEDKYCSVIATIRPGASISSEFTINPE